MPARQRLLLREFLGLVFCPSRDRRADCWRERGAGGDARSGEEGFPGDRFAVYEWERPSPSGGDRGDQYGGLAAAATQICGGGRP